MPREKQKLSMKLKLYVKDYPVFKTDGKVLFCKICNKSVSGDKLFCVKQHLRSISHTERENRFDGIEERPQRFLAESLAVNKNEEFKRDLCEAFVAADIPIYKIRNDKLRTFMEKYTSYKMPSETSVRKNINSIYVATIEHIKNYVTNRYLWVSIDETTDIAGRYVANVVIGILDSDGDMAKKIFLLNTVKLEKADHSSIARLFDDSVRILGEDFDKNKVLLLLTDAAPYMVKAAKAIQIFFPKVTHVTCIAHGLHRVCEHIRDLHPMVDQLIANVKKIFLKSPSRVKIFKDSAPDLPLPPRPVITRWGTWLEAVTYYAQHFEKIAEIVSSLDCGGSLAIKTVQNLFKNDKIRSEIIFIHANYASLTKLILKLETAGLSLSVQMQILTDAENQIKSSNLLTVEEKFKTVFNKNRGLKIVKNISNQISGAQCEANNMYTVSEITAFKYCPLTTVNVERTFSMFKNVLRDNRNFEFENLAEYFVVYCNNNI